MYKFVVALALSSAAATTLGQNAPYPATFFRSPSANMAPDIPMGSLIVIEPYTGKVNRGDIVAFTRGDSPTQFIKRAVAVPGDRIKYSDKGLTVNEKIQVGFEKSSFSKLTELTGTPVFPAFGESIVLDAESIYVLSNSADDMLDSRSQGTINPKQVQGKVILWRDILSVEGWPKTYLSRVIANLVPALPKEIEEGFTLTNLALKGDRVIFSTVRIEYSSNDSKLGARMEHFSQNRKAAYCNGSFEPKTFGVSASYLVISNTGDRVAEFGFSPMDCP
jgi:signal peptidase I